eukprot:CAMPEP_0113451808 /NCGR_PEP_ID=MMETSP0014_2-20120614/6526_1 /TAXON_ID=2857 /ORGANISM="Nitzschia sp." /LENGTH=468 /DNA_ID=CAMNT_0000343169 /DNA_START=129 /DNA_END=1535 /DNA_ORIENTATION=- /assembly_acc=CAM_ASM_000159
MIGGGSRRTGARGATVSGGRRRLLLLLLFIWYNLLLLGVVNQLLVSFQTVHAQSSTPRVIADVFECDLETGRPLLPTAGTVDFDDATLPPRPYTHEFHFCIEPNLPTLNRGIVLASINNFGFLKDETGISQLLIGDGSKVIDPNLTTLRCNKGATQCSVSTFLRTDFFDSRLSNIAKIRGIAEVFFQNKDEGNYVGQDNGDISVDVVLTDNFDQPQISTSGGTPASSTVKTGWEDLPEWARIVIIVAVIVFFLCVIFCILACCFYGFFGGGTSSKEPRRNKSSHRTHTTTTTQRVVMIDPETGEEILQRRQLQRPRKPSRKNMIDEDYEDNTEYAEEDEDSGRFFDPSHREMDGDEDDDAYSEEEEDEEEDEENFVYFDSEDQPGTIAFREALEETVAEYQDEDYSPDVYRHLKKQLPDKTFMIYDYHDEDDDVEGEWREMTKKELIKRFKKEFKKEKRRLEKEEKEE